MSDMLVKLYALEEDNCVSKLNKANIYIKKAFITDKSTILTFVKDNFPDASGWVNECEYALLNDPISCYIAVKDKAIIGFACYNATAKGFFGPMGVKKEYRNSGIGKALLKQSLFSMKENGYAYAIIGWAAKDAIEFYERNANATLIEDAPPNKSIYKNMIVGE
jgi:GNAT superfamily N-acetyltransferase